MKPTTIPSSFLLSRRHFLLGTAAFGLVLSAYPGLVLANARTDNRLVLVILRGAMDGLAAVVPYGDPNYSRLREDLTLNGDMLRKLDEKFALHSALDSLYSFYQEKNLAIVHAVASPYRERSHFDAQNVLELGTNQVGGAQNGWLNRVVQSINARDKKSDVSLALAIGNTVPLVLRGQANVVSWAPQIIPDARPELFGLISKMYAHDPKLSRAIADGLIVQDETSDAMKGQDSGQSRKMRNSFPQMAETAGKFLTKETGPRIATLELDGWDTHVNQGTEAGRLANNFKILAEGLRNMRTALGPVWSKTTVVVMTEFGRTVRVNGNGGTDHGTGTLMFVIGGNVKGGQYGHWPGLAEAQLYQNRDLYPTTDIRSVMKGILNDLYGLSPAVLAHDIYPESSNVPIMSDLIKV